MKVRQVKESGRYGSSNPDLMSPGSYDRFQQDQMDYGKREFKRREMEHELGHEDEQQRKEQYSTYYIRINGKLLKNKEGQPYQFRGKEAANKAAVTMMSKPFNRDKKFTLTTTASDKQDNPTPESSIAEMDGAPGQILAATGDKVTIDNKDGTQTIAPKASLTRDPTGKGFVLSKTPAPGGEKPDEPKPGETVFQPATTEGIKKMNETIRMLRLAGLHNAADRLTEQLVERAGDEPMSDADYAKQMAQGQKNLNAVKGFFGGKPAAPAELKDAPPGTSIDPIVRQRMGYKPATQQDIAAFQTANPNAGKVVSGDGKPIKTGDGSDLVSGGGQAVTQAAQAAAPAAPLPTGTVDPNAGELGNQTPSTRMPPTGAAANPMGQDPAQRAQAAAAPQTGAASNMAKDPAQRAQAAAPEDNPEAAYGAGSGAAPVAANQAASPAASTWKGQTDEFGGMESPKAPAAQQVDPNQADADDAQAGADMRAMAAGGNSTSAATGAGNPGEEAAAADAAELARMKQLAGVQAANGVNAAGQNVTMPDGTNPESGEKTTTAAAPAPTQAASPAAAAKTPAKSDPKVLALQQDLIKKGAKIKPDGVMGPATAAAQKQFGAARDPNAAYRGDRSDMKPAAPAAPAKQPQNKAPAVPPAAARPGVNKPAPAKPAGGQAASPAAPAPAPAPAAGAPTPSLINRFRASRGLPTSEDRQYYEELDKMLTIARLR